MSLISKCFLVVNKCVSGFHIKAIYRNRLRIKDRIDFRKAREEVVCHSALGLGNQKSTTRFWGTTSNGGQRAVYLNFTYQLVWNSLNLL